MRVRITGRKKGSTFSAPQRLIAIISQFLFRRSHSRNSFIIHPRRTVIFSSPSAILALSEHRGPVFGARLRDGMVMRRGRRMQERQRRLILPHYYNRLAHYGHRGIIWVPRFRQTARAWRSGKCCGRFGALRRLQKQPVGLQESFWHHNSIASIRGRPPRTV